MTKEELIEKLKEQQLNDDEETAHSIADDLLLEYINDREVDIAFAEVPKWYA